MTYHYAKVKCAKCKSRARTTAECEYCQMVLCVKCHEKVAVKVPGHGELKVVRVKVVKD